MHYVEGEKQDVSTYYLRDTFHITYETQGQAKQIRCCRYQNSG